MDTDLYLHVGRELPSRQSWLSLFGIALVPACIHNNRRSWHLRLDQACWKLLWLCCRVQLAMCWTTPSSLWMVRHALLSIAMSLASMCVLLFPIIWTVTSIHVCQSCQTVFVTVGVVLLQAFMVTPGCLSTALWSPSTWRNHTYI